MIDKVEVRIPRATRFSGDFRPLYQDYSGDSAIFRESRHYLRVGDLRNLGYSSILHMYCTHGKTGNHKLELVEVGGMPYGAIQREIGKIFDVEPLRLELMRIDLAVDVPGVDVRWFARNSRVKWKQWVAEIGKIEYAEMGRRKVETLYFGKRPNCIRIYDKISEWNYQYDKLLRNASDAAEIPTFEEMYKYPQSGFVLTRVERQIAGGRVPEQINRVGRLRSLPDFNPFDRLELLPAGYREPEIGHCGVKDYLAGRGLRAVVEDIGLHQTRALLNSHSRGNASRIMARFSDFLPGEWGVDSEQLYRRYRDSVSQQLAA